MSAVTCQCGSENISWGQDRNPVAYYLHCNQCGKSGPRAGDCDHAILAWNTSNEQIPVTCWENHDIRKVGK